MLAISTSMRAGAWSAAPINRASTDAALGSLNMNAATADESTTLTAVTIFADHARRFVARRHSKRTDIGTDLLDRHRPFRKRFGCSIDDRHQLALKRALVQLRALLQQLDLFFRHVFDREGDAHNLGPFARYCR